MSEEEKEKCYGKQLETKKESGIVIGHSYVICRMLPYLAYLLSSHTNRAALMLDINVTLSYTETNTTLRELHVIVHTE